MDKRIKVKAIPVTEKTYPVVIGILRQADYAPSRRDAFDFSPEWTGSVICVEEAEILSLDDIEIENAQEGEPYFLEIDGNLLVANPHGSPFYYPCMINAKGYEFDSYTIPLEEECLCRVVSEEEVFVEGACYIRSEGTFEIWDTHDLWPPESRAFSFQRSRIPAA